MNWIDANLEQITAVAVVLILLAGRNKLLPVVKQSTFILWFAWSVTVICGLVLGWAMVGVMSWLTGLDSVAGRLVGSVGAIIAVGLGWHAVSMLVALVRDLADRRPDDDARKAALWIPTLLPAGGSAVWGIVTHPSGLGTGLTAAIMAAITIVYAHKIVKAALAGKTWTVGWRWFAAVVCLIAGIALTPLLLFADAQAAAHMPFKYLVALRVLAGAVGAALLIAAVRDFKDRIPDQYVRAFLRFGVPILGTFGVLAVATISGHAGDGLQILTGSMR